MQPIVWEEETLNIWRNAQSLHTLHVCIAIGFCLFVCFSFVSFFLSDSTFNWENRGAALLLREKSKAARCQAEWIFFFFSNWVKTHSVANNNLRSSWLSLGPVGEYRMTWPSLWDRSPLALGLGVLGVSIYTVLLKSISEWGWNYVRDTPNQWWSGSWDPRFPQWWRNPLPTMLETSEARMR